MTTALTFAIGALAVGLCWGIYRVTLTITDTWRQLHDEDQQALEIERSLRMLREQRSDTSLGADPNERSDYRLADYRPDNSRRPA